MVFSLSRTKAIVLLTFAMTAMGITEDGLSNEKDQAVAFGIIVMVGIVLSIVLPPIVYYYKQWLCLWGPC